MKKNLTKLIIVAILISTLNPIANTSQAKAKTKKIICLSLKGNTLTYADAVWTYELGIEDENIVGRPKKHTMKLASKVSYSLLFHIGSNAYRCIIIIICNHNSFIGIQCMNNFAISDI